MATSVDSQQRDALKKFNTIQLSSYQKEIYWDQKINPNLSHNQLGFKLRMDGDVDTKILRKSLLELAIKYMACSHFQRGNLVLCIGVRVVTVNWRLH